MWFDWMTPSDQRGWYLYEREEREVFANEKDGSVKMKGGKPETRTEADNWEERGYFQSYDEALDAAQRLAGHRD